MFNLQWYGPGLARLNDKARKHNCKPLVHYDESDLSTVWLSIPQEPGVMVRADAVDPDYQNNLPFYEHQLACDAIDKEGLTFSKKKAARALANIYLSLSELEYKKSKKQKQQRPITLATKDDEGDARAELEDDVYHTQIDLNVTEMKNIEDSDDDLETFKLE